MTHEFFMKAAMAEAARCLNRDEFPVGCVIVHDGCIIAGGARQGTVGDFVSETDHAEIMALKHLERLPEAIDRTRLTLYSTLEPCLMCYGAILISGIRSIVYAYEDVMGGGTRCDLSRLPPLYAGQPVHIVPHVLRKESLALFQAFFSNPANRYWKDSLLETYTLSAE